MGAEDFLMSDGKWGRKNFSSSIKYAVFFLILFEWEILYPFYNLELLPVPEY